MLIFQVMVCASAFSAAAKLHGKFFNDRDVFKYSWLRGSEWLRGEGKEQWEGSQHVARLAWERAKEMMSTSSVVWNPLLIAVMEAGIAKVSWAAFQEQLKSTNFNFSVIHGDFHPANILWTGGSACGDSVEGVTSVGHAVDSRRNVVVDWEMVGFGNGAQDCAQYMISHMRPSERRACESKLLHGYYDELCAIVTENTGGCSYTYEQCYGDYVDGGVGRWLWLLAYMAPMLPALWIQYFHDQVLEFIQDHGVTADRAPMVRV